MHYIYKEDAIYSLKEDGTFLVHVTFPLVKEGMVNIDHTYVDISLRGQGVASLLMHETMKYLIEKKYKIVATCPYAVAWLKREKKYHDHVDFAYMTQLGEACIIS